jgi:hypothetical protein
VASLDRKKHYAYLDISKKMVKKEPHWYAVSGKDPKDFKQCTLQTITEDCGPKCSGPTVTLKTSVPIA